MPSVVRHLTRACIHLDRLTHNLQLLQELATGVARRPSRRMPTATAWRSLHGTWSVSVTIRFAWLT